MERIEWDKLAAWIGLRLLDEHRALLDGVDGHTLLVCAYLAGFADGQASKDS